MTEFDNWATSPRAITWDESLAFEAPLLAEAHETWKTAGGIPLRSQMTARLLKNFVGNLVIFERQGADAYLIRLMGTRVTGVLGEMQCKMLTEALPPEAAERWSMALTRVLDSRKPVRVVTLVNVNDLQFLEAELLLAPLRNDQGEETMVMSVAVFRSGVNKSRALDDLVAKP